MGEIVIIGMITTGIAIFIHPVLGLCGIPIWLFVGVMYNREKEEPKEPGEQQARESDS